MPEERSPPRVRAPALGLPRRPSLGGSGSVTIGGLVTHEPRCPVPHGPAPGDRPEPVTGSPRPDSGPRPGAGRCPVGGHHHANSEAPSSSTAPALAPSAEQPSASPAVPPSWDPETLARTTELATGRAPASRVDPDRAAQMARRAAEERAADRGVERITDLFVRTLGRKLGYGHPLSERTGEVEFTWTEEAEARLREVPEFCRELTRWRVEWTAQKLGLGTTITPEVMAVKYDMWGRVSHAIRDRRAAGDGLPWTESAYARFERIPDFVKGQVLEAVEGNARRLGATIVDDAVVDQVIARWAETGDFHEGKYGFR